jgi:hypothetical protein
LSRVSISADDGEVVPQLIALVGFSLAKVVLKRWRSRKLQWTIWTQLGNIFWSQKLTEKLRLKN